MTPFESARAPIGATGFLILAPDTDLTIYIPKWHQSTYFLPVGSPQPGMKSTHDDNWYHRVPDLIRCAGTRRQISFLNKPADYETSGVQPSPYDLLRQTVWSMSGDTHPYWQDLFRRKGRRGPAIPNPNWSVLIQGKLYGYPKTPHWRCPIDNALMVLSPPVAMALQTLLHEDEAVEQMFEPDITNHGPSLLRFYRHPRYERLSRDWQLVRESPTRIPTGADQGKDRLLCQMVRPSRGVHLSCPSPVERALALRPWGSLVRRLTVAEQLRLLATAYDCELIRAVFLGTAYEPHLPDWLVDARERQTNPTW